MKWTVSHNMFMYSILCLIDTFVIVPYVILSLFKKLNNMINSIIKTFYNISREHKLIRQFVYDKVSKSAGIGEENMPLCHLEDPIIIHNSSLTDGSVRCSVNFDIVMSPHAFENYNMKQLTIEECQTIAHSIALNYVAKLRDINLNYEKYDENEYNTSIKVIDYNFVTLRYWFDNSAAGVRCSMVISVDNPISYCDLEGHFDPDKEFDINELLTDINTDDAEGCSASFGYKLPKFHID